LSCGKIVVGTSVVSPLNKPASSSSALFFLSLFSAQLFSPPRQPSRLSSHRRSSADRFSLSPILRASQVELHLDLALLSAASWSSFFLFPSHNPASTAVTR
jgi:hypothetical protein